jgi:hypothetical protein
MNFLERSLQWLMGKFWSVSPSPSPQKPLPKENEDYCFSEIILAEETVNAVKILTGPFKNVIYYYGHVKIVPEGDTHRLAYQYTIWDSARFTKAELTDAVEFSNTMGDILVAIIADENNVGEYSGPTREDDTEESDLS